MSNDFWRQWQALSTLSPFGRSAAGPGPSASATAAPGFAPFADAAERFATAIREFVAQAHRASSPSNADSGTAFAAADGLGNFLRECFAGVFQPPWLSSPGATAPIGYVFSEAPALGLGREHWLRAQRGIEAWERVGKAQGRLSRMWSDTLRDAAGSFTSRLQPVPAEPLTAEVIDRLYDLWIDCAEEAYARIAHSDPFCDALSEYVNAAGQWRRESAADVEEWAKLLDLPTRSEINTLTLRLREVEAQLLASQRQPEGTTAKPPRARNPPRTRKPARSRKAQDPQKPQRSGKPRPRRSTRSS
jgi:Poly(R)-hydroxyalkanoic acid synthase subunit (PHA_synth_III_E)